MVTKVNNSEKNIFDFTFNILYYLGCVGVTVIVAGWDYQWIKIKKKKSKT